MQPYHQPKNEKQYSQILYTKSYQVRRTLAKKKKGDGTRWIKHNQAPDFETYKKDSLDGGLLRRAG